jgi:CHAD domain-containing protein
MKTICPEELLESSVAPRTLTLGEYAHQVIEHQYQTILKQEKKVLADQDPEYLHDMRVAMRRLRTALQVFERAIVLPKRAQEKQVGAIAKVLGHLRDLDVQLADLRDHYQPQMQGPQQRLLNGVLKSLKRERKQAFTATKHLLTRSPYRQFKVAYQHWLAHPCYTSLARLPLLAVLPDLLSPLLSNLLLHPGWFIQVTDPSAAGSDVLHDLRKACKHARYQAEFFAPFYGEALQTWIQEVKHLQDRLGKVHDSQVLLALIQAHVPPKTNLQEVQSLVQQTFVQEMGGWERLRLQYLDPDYRYSLHRMLLSPPVLNAPTG